VRPPLMVGTEFSIPVANMNVSMTGPKDWRWLTPV
jgi:hypothetical protein